ncbi:hypothetical protein [Petroclostridium sp. X23]|uniref:hypothetical protein n=1 Tax=Petroclostridium sp. X23 TaxID=3045146 RepID=UPI0024ACFDFC|nr:hypothetical protein [Petroclostridium sp. X23]WHH57487.1 hypothetical protein QKW49_16835 [Petroclostridium sp. X23]
MIEKSYDMPDFEVVVVYSGLSTALIGTDYNNRVDECKIAACILEELAYGKISGIKDVRLRDVDIDAYKKYREQLPRRFRRRADHFFVKMIEFKEV